MEKESKIIKEKKPRKFYFRKFKKDIKMIRWPKGNVLGKSFVVIVTFAIIFSLVVFGLLYVINIGLDGMGVN